MNTGNHGPKSGSLDPSSEALHQPSTAGGIDRLTIAGDPISDVLETIRLRGALFFLWEPRWPYATGVADGRRIASYIVPGADLVISYHIVTEGPCWAAVSGEAPLRLDTGDILVLPRGDAYKIASSPEYPRAEEETASIEFFRLMAAGEIPAMVVDGGPGPQRNSLICGFLGCNLHAYHPLLSTLPPMIRIPPPTAGEDPLSLLIHFACSEAGQARGGERCLLARLSETLFVEVLRRYLRSLDSSGPGWLQGLRHPLVGRALHLLHLRLSHPWILAELAAQVGTSRSTLSAKFTEVVGVPPMQYLLRWRMQVAASRLADGAAKTYAVAREVGYESETTFGRAFKRVAGQSPGRWRRQRFGNLARTQDPNYPRVPGCQSDGNGQECG